MVNIQLLSREAKLKQLAQDEFDVLIIGAGITGSSTAWDAAQRGLKVALIDKEDFGAGTSSGSSKLVHAGIRYLAYGEFNLVRHASRERMWMFKYIPHQTLPIPFIIPIYKKGKNTTLKMIFAGVLYDILSKFKNTENHRFLNKKKTLNKIPNIKSDVLKRSLYYWDGVMDDARVTLEVVLSAQEEGALCVNHLEATDFVLQDNEKGEKNVQGVIVKDKFTGKETTIKSRIVINAAGPWCDLLVKKLGYERKLLRPTKGMHIITKRIVKEDIVVVITADDERGMFVIPFRKDYSIIGTTDTYYSGNLDHVKVTQEDIDYVISATNNDFPNSITIEDVISAYSGIRPLLISPKAKSETDTSRGFDIITILPNFLTITGGKYTIFRYMAEKMVDRIVKSLNLQKGKYRCQTKDSFVHGGTGITDIKHYIKVNLPTVMKKYDLEEDIAEHIINTYGTAHKEVLTFIDSNKELAKRIGTNRPHIYAEIHHVINNEMCLTLSDFMLRRTQLQLIDHQGLDCLDEIVDEMAKILKWNDSEKQKQIEDYKNDLVWL
ncbi:MAG: glycerol-3-phosphate dehydrogenase/oxidase [Asgard group archaeon]|nr:glycerol-3-phosphate dehydrogenase/oxidase [Asgard group archaeon]